jgi:DNA-binding winged helix-turn-helix (wHTH) protein
MSVEPIPAVVRFGDFELDLRSQELRRGRLRLNLETKSFQILELLVENSDRLVTRRELREKLWPDSFVEFDRGIYTAMNRLRKALGDTTENPRYIQTRSGLGYRFVAPVSPALVRTGSVLRPLPGDANLTSKPGLVGFNAQRSPAFAVTSNPRFDGDALRFEVRRPGGEPAELTLRLTTTNEGALNMRLDLCGAVSEEGRKVPSRGQAGPNSSHQSGHFESSLGRARR